MDEMMRKLIVAGLVAGLMVAGAASVSMADNDIGCGWGTMVFEGKSGMGPKVLGATTNGFFGNQTFGITFGTAGCSSEGVITADARIRMFASSNLDRLAMEMAEGQGKALDALAHLMNIQLYDRPAFFSLTKTHFAELFPSDHVTAGAMLTSLNTLMAADPRLSVYAAS